MEPIIIFHLFDYIHSIFPKKRGKKKKLHRVTKSLWVMKKSNMIKFIVRCSLLLHISTP